MANRGSLLSRNLAPSRGVGPVSIWLGSMLVRGVVRALVEVDPSEEVMVQFGLTD